MTKLLIVYGTHGNQGFATVARIKDLDPLKNTADWDKANMQATHARNTGQYVAKGRMVKLDGSLSGLSNEIPLNQIAGFSGMWSGNAFVGDWPHKSLPKKAE